MLDVKTGMIALAVRCQAVRRQTVRRQTVRRQTVRRQTVRRRASKIEQMPKIISLGSSCFILKFWEQWFDYPRLPFDYATTPHNSLLSLLNTKFQNILQPQKIHSFDKFRIGFYGPHAGYTFGHVDEKYLEKVSSKIKRRCNRFLDLIKENETNEFLFIRERLRNSIYESSFFPEKAHDKGIELQLIKEYIDLHQTLKNFGFSKFKLVYLIHSPIFSCEGLIHINDQKLNEIHKVVSDYFFVFKEKFDFDPSEWDRVKNLINNRFIIKQNSDVLNQHQDQQGLVAHNI
jgi:hypothetical protein